MTATSFIRFINSKLFLFCAVVIFFIPFFLFSFWNFPSADDYMILDKQKIYSFWHLQSWVYHTWTGRYFATFVSAVFSYKGFLYSHYYVHAILLFLFTVLSWLFCLIQINKLLLSNRFSLSFLLLVSLLLLVLQINIIPEPVTAFYWFSSAITYQLSLILLILLVGVITKLFSKHLKTNVPGIIAGFLIILINGCNEVITLFILVAATFLAAYSYYNFKKISPYFLFLYILNVVSACFLLFAPGIIHRASLMGHSSFISIVCIAAAKFTFLNWYFLKEPLWWFSAIFACIYFNKNDVLRNAINRFKRLSPAYILLFYFLSGLFTYIPVLYFSNGSMPLRSENILCFLYSLLLLFITSVYVSTRTTAIISSGSVVFRYRYLLFSILIFAAANMKNVSDTLLSGFFYSQVMKERLGLFISAKQKNEHEITFSDYETAVNKKIKEYPLLDRKLLKEIIIKPPPIICFENDLYDLNFLKELYGINKLNIQKN